jgi:hypothetical protein
MILNGERPAIEAASVKLLDRAGATLGEGSTSMMGIVAFATPANLRDEDLALEVEHADFNRRKLSIDGAPIHADIRKLLYA